VADVTGGTVLAEIEIAASPERVFRALSDPAERLRWWGSPDTYVVDHCEWELRVGARWVSTGHGADGRSFKVEGEFLEIDPPRRLVQTWITDYDGGFRTTLSFQLDPAPGGTRLTVRHDGFAGYPGSCTSHARGWEAVLGWLESHVAPPPTAPTRVPPPTRHPAAPANLKAYVLALYFKGPRYSGMEPTATAELMARHLAFLEEQIRIGRLVFASPVLDDGPLAATAFVRTGLLEEARTWLAQDPGVAAGRFVVEVHPSWAPDLDPVVVRYEPAPETDHRRA
jgi:uncharacterized protein YndB with AHSA1/START domain/uncharacterized protein YciI